MKRDTLVDSTLCTGRLFTYALASLFLDLDSGHFLVYELLEIAGLLGGPLVVEIVQQPNAEDGTCICTRLVRVGRTCMAVMAAWRRAPVSLA